MLASRKYRSTSNSPLNPYPPCTWTAQSVTRWAIWAPYSLAIETSSVLSCPKSRRCAARRVRSRAASISTADCAIISRTSWKSPIGRPNAFRSCTYFDAASRAARATPTAPAAMPIRPLFGPSSPHLVPPAPRGGGRLPRAAPARGPGEAPPPDPPPLRGGQEPLLLLRLRAEPHEGGLAQGRLHGDRRADGRGTAADLLDEEHERDVVHADPAVLLGHRGAEEAEARHLAVEGPRDLVCLLPIPDVRDVLSVVVVSG